MVGSFWFVGCCTTSCAGNGYVVCRTPDRRSQKQNDDGYIVRTKACLLSGTGTPQNHFETLSYPKWDINSTRSRSMRMTSDGAGDCERSTSSRPTNRASGWRHSDNDQPTTNNQPSFDRYICIEYIYSSIYIFLLTATAATATAPVKVWNVATTIDLWLSQP